VRRAVLLLATASTLACHTMRFEIAHIPSDLINDPIQVRKSFWLAGAFPTETIDVRTICPNGAAAVEEETSWVDALIYAVTLSIYTPRTSWYYCRRDPYVVPQPAPVVVAPPQSGSPTP